MKYHFEENMNQVYYNYSDKCGLDNTYTIEDVERTKITGDQLQKIKDTMESEFGIDPREVKQVFTVVVTIVISGSLDTVTITHKQKVMKMNGKWYFCPIDSRDPFGLVESK